MRAVGAASPPSSLRGHSETPIWRSDAAAGWNAGPLSRAGEGQGEGCDFSGRTGPLTPTLSRTGEGARRASQEPMYERRTPQRWREASARGGQIR
ncbi:hypothetical protein MOR12E_10090 [Methylobacterium oryzae]